MMLTESRGLNFFRAFLVNFLNISIVELLFATSSRLFRLYRAKLHILLNHSFRCLNILLGATLLVEMCYAPFPPPLYFAFHIV